MPVASRSGARAGLPVMRHALQWILSLLFIIQLYAVMAVLAVVYLPYAIATPDGALAACKAFCRWTVFSLRVMTGLRCEVRGEVPSGEVLVAAKHQSFLDILLIFGAVPHGRFIMKRELLWTPILGQFALRLGCVPVDRGRRGVAVAKMMEDVATGARSGGQIVIYPEGTRVAPGARLPYKAGSAALYGQLGQPCVPVATNVGVFWPKRGILRRPGLAVVEFLAPIPPGLAREPFMARLEAEIEDASARLLAEARTPGAGHDAPPAIS